MECLIRQHYPAVCIGYHDSIGHGFEYRSDPALLPIQIQQTPATLFFQFLRLPSQPEFVELPEEFYPAFLQTDTEEEADESGTKGKH